MTAPDSGPDADAFEAFYRASWAPCLRTVVTITLDTAHAEDDTAEAFTRAFERWTSLRDHPSPAAWVVQTATNLHRDRRRRLVRLRERLPAILQHSPQVVQEVDITLDRVLDPALLRALRGLPQRQRETLALRVLLGMTGVETASYLGVAPGSVATHLHRALAALRGVAEVGHRAGASDAVPPPNPGQGSRLTGQAAHQQPRLRLEVTP